MNPAPAAMELQARIEEAWGERNARSALANTARLSAWEAKRPLILERDLPADHVRRVDAAGLHKATAPTVPAATSAKATVCENGSVFLQLHDADARPFAVLHLDGNAFARLVDHVAECIERIEAQQAVNSHAQGLH